MDLPADSGRLVLSRALDTGLTCIFTLEMVIKAVPFGFALDKQSYLRDYWNQLDFLIVLVS